MKLKYKYEKQEDIPEGYGDLYEEQSGEWVLQVEGVKTSDDVERVQEALRKEREDHKATKQKLQAFGDLDPEQVREQLDEVEELRAKAEAAGGEVSDEKIEELVQKRLDRHLAPVKRERDKLKTDLENVTGERDDLSESIRRGKIRDAVRDAAEKSKVTNTAIDDVLLYGEKVFDVDENDNVTVRDEVGFTPGLKPDEWLNEMQQKRPHWWPGSEGAGSRGGDGGGDSGEGNPWRAENWNLTQQGQIMQQDASKAERLAKQAGTTVNGPKPAPAK